jgi:putative transcriptional regulator
MAKHRTASEHEARLLRSADEALEVARGERAPARVVTHTTVREASAAPAPLFRPARIAALRARLRLSQPVFAQVLSVSTATVRAWEQGQKKPAGPARRLLELVDAEPALVLSRLQRRSPGASNPVGGAYPESRGTPRLVSEALPKAVGIDRHGPKPLPRHPKKRAEETGKRGAKK